MALDKLTKLTSQSGITTTIDYQMSDLTVDTITVQSGGLKMPVGMSTFQNVTVTGDLTVNGTTTTLDTDLIGVDKLEVSGNNTTAVGIITQAGSGDILRLYDSTTEVFKVADGGTSTFTVGTNKSVQIYAATHNDESDLGAGIGFSRQSDGATPLSGIFGHSNSGLGIAARDHITFLTGGTSLVNDTEERLRITSTGRVGIGTVSPNAPLDVYRSGTGTVVDTIITRTSGGGAFAVQCSNIEAANPVWALRTYSSEDLVLSPGGHADANEKVRIKASTGRVGIGEDSPDTNLHVKGTGTDILKIESTDAGAQGANLILQHSPGSGNMADNDVISLLQFNGVDDSNNATTYASIRAVATDVSNNTEKGDLTFFTRNGGTFGERLRIDKDGCVRVGNTHNQTTSSNTKRIALGGKGSIWGWVSGQIDGSINLADNYYWDGVNNRAIEAADAAYLALRLGTLRFGTTDSTPSAGGVTGLTEKFRITSDGEVGIGITNPATILNIKSAKASDGLTITKGSNVAAFLGHNGTGDEGLLHLKDGGTATIQIYGETGQVSFFNAGNVGIVTTAPQSKLELDGRFRILDNNDATPSTGKGLEISYYTDSDMADILSYDRGNSAYKKLQLRGSSIELKKNNAAKIIIGTGGSGNTVGFSTTTTLVTNAEAIAVRGYSSFKSTSPAYAAIYLSSEGNTTDTANQLLMFNAGGANRGGIGYVPNTGELRFNHQYYMTFCTGSSIMGGTERLRIAADGEILVPAAGANRLSMRHTSGGNFVIKNPTAAYLSFGTNNNDEEFVIANGGNVGINSTTPNKLLDVHSTNTNTYSSAASNTPSTGSVIQLTNKSGTDGSGSGYYSGLQFSIASGATSSGWLTFHRTGDNKGDFTFTARNAGSSYPELMRIKSTGVIGVNNATPDGKGIDVSHGRTNAYSGTSDHRGLAHIIARNTSDAPGRFASISLVQGGSTQAEASINLVQTGNYIGDVTIKTRYGATSWAERLRITSGGKVSIGDAATHSFSAHSEGDDLVIGGAGWRGMTIYGEGGGGVIQFADDGDNRRGQIMYNHGDDSMNFRVSGNATKLKITSGGNIKIGHNNTSGSVDGEDKLNIKGDGAQYIYIGSNDASAAGIYFDGDSNGDMAGSDYARIAHNTDGYMQHDNWKSGCGHRFAVGGSTKLQIQPDGELQTFNRTDQKFGLSISNEYGVWGTNTGLAPNTTRTWTITNSSYGWGRFCIGGGDGNYQRAACVIDYGGVMWATAKSYYHNEIIKSSSGASISTTYNNGSIVVSVTAGSNWWYYTANLIQGRRDSSSWATITQS